MEHYTSTHTPHAQGQCHHGLVVKWTVRHTHNLSFYMQIRKPLTLPLLLYLGEKVNEGHIKFPCTAEVSVTHRQDLAK
jgi:hypothetical protein